MRHSWIYRFHGILTALSLILFTGTASSHAETLTGTVEPNLLAGKVESSLLQGGGGDDFLYGDPGLATAPLVKIELVSATRLFELGEEDSIDATISADGKKIAFVSNAPSFLPPGILSAELQIYLKDTTTGELTLVTQDDKGHPGNGSSSAPAFSPDGRFLVFTTSATNLPKTEIPPNTYFQIVMKDLMTGAYRVLTRTKQGDFADGPSFRPVFSPDGKVVMFQSYAGNLLLNGLDSNGMSDIFALILDDPDMIFRRLSTATGGGEANGGSSNATFSPDGKAIAFESFADNLLGPGMDQNGMQADVYYKDIDQLNTVLTDAPGEILLVSRDANAVQGMAGDSGWPAFSPDGREIAFSSTSNTLIESDTNANGSDIFIKTVKAGGPRPVETIRLVSRAEGGAQANAGSFFPSFSPDGSALIFGSKAGNLVPGVPSGLDQVYIKDILTPNEWGTIQLLSRKVASGGLIQPGNGYSSPVAFSKDGTKVLFQSSSSNLIVGDGNYHADIFLATLGPPPGGNDTLDGGTGKDFMAGGTGDDVYVVDNLDDIGFERPSEGTDTFMQPFDGILPSNIENLILSGNAVTGNFGNELNNLMRGNGNDNSLYGRAGSDRLYGAPGDDWLDGGSGNDLLYGEAGEDILRGGTGKDVLIGGSEKDVFVYMTPLDSPAGKKNRDTIADFNMSEGDILDLSLIDANPRLPGDQRFRYIGERKFKGRAGEARFKNGLFSADINGDKKPDFQIKIIVKKGRFRKFNKSRIRL